MAKKGAKRRRIKEQQQKEWQIKKEKKEQVQSKKRAGAHVLNQMNFKNKEQEDTYNVLAGHFLRDHYPKILDIVPKEVREARGEIGHRETGKLYGKHITSIKTKDEYAKRIKTMIKYHVIIHDIKSLSDINAETMNEFYQTIADNTGKGEGKYSTKTYDMYVDAGFKFGMATTASPENAKITYEGREFSNAIASHREFANRKFKDGVRSKVKNYSKEDKKRGSGYTSTQANTIMNQVEKHLDPEQQLMVALLVYGGMRNEEARSVDHGVFDKKNSTLDLVNNNNKLGRARITQDVDQRLFEKYDQYVKWKEEKGEKAEGNIFSHYTDNTPREIVKECCRLGKIKYSGVHDLRQAYVEREEKKLQQKVLKGEITKDELVDKFMKNVEAHPSLNPMVPKVKWIPKYKEGKLVGHRSKRLEQKEIKYSREKLLIIKIEDLVDMYVAQQIGHNDPDTTQEAYRNKNAKMNRGKFRKKMKNK